MHILSTQHYLHATIKHNLLIGNLNSLTDNGKSTDVQTITNSQDNENKVANEGMDNDIIEISPNNKDYDLEGNGIIQTKIGNDVSDGIPGSDDDSGVEKGPESDIENVQTSDKSVDGDEDENPRGNGHTNGSDNQETGKPMDSLLMLLGSTPIEWSKIAEIYKQVGRPRHRTTADIIHDISELLEPADREEKRRDWTYLICKDEIQWYEVENLRKRLHKARCDKAALSPNQKFQIDIGKAQDVLNDLHRHQKYYKEDGIDVQLRPEEEELRAKILYHCQDMDTRELRYWQSRHPATKGPLNSNSAGQILVVDALEARCTRRELEELQSRTQGTGLVTYISKCCDVLTFPLDYERGSIPQGNGSEATKSQTDVGRKTEDNENCENAERQMGNEGDMQERQHGSTTDEVDTWDDSDFAEFIARPKQAGCCDPCPQCQDRVSNGLDRLINRQHHKVQVRIFIDHTKHFTFYSNDKHPLETVEMHCCKTANLSCKGDAEFYWQNIEFYNRIMTDAKRMLPCIWPFRDYRNAGIKVTIAPERLAYKTRNSSKTKWLCLKTLNKDICKNLPEPRHVFKSDVENMTRNFPRQFCGKFDLYMKVETLTEKAKEQRLALAEDAFAKRLKIILNDRQQAGSSSDLHIIGAVLMTVAAYKEENRKDRMDPTVPPYPEATLASAFGQMTHNDYKRALHHSRTTEKPQKMNAEAHKLAPQKATTRKEVSPQTIKEAIIQYRANTVAPPSEATTTKDTTKIMGQTQSKEKMSPSKSTTPEVAPRRIYMNPPRSYTSRVRPTSRDRRSPRDVDRDKHNGGKGYLGARHQSVFLRLADTRPTRKMEAADVKRRKTHRD
jgi:hypothetical protein